MRETLESSEAVRQDIGKVLKSPESHKAHGYDDISSYILKKFSETLNRPREKLRKLMEEG